MSTTTMNFPSGVTEIVYQDGTVDYTDTDGNIEVPNEFVADVMAMGAQPADLSSSNMSTVGSAGASGGTSIAASSASSAASSVVQAWTGSPIERS